MGIKPDVSVIIPTFNRLWCLPEAIESCRQNECSTEIIVIDDGSTDGTWEWLQTQADVLSARQPNWGQDCALNKGFSMSRGEFIRFLDSDDFLLPNANDIQLAIGQREKADVVVSGHIVVYHGSGVCSKRDWTFCDDFISQQLGECDSSHYSAYILRRDFITDIPHRQEFAFREDRIFIIEVALKYPKVAVCGQPCLYHRHHGLGRVQFPQGMRAIVTNWQHAELYRKVLTLLDARDELTLRRKRAAIRVLWPLAHWIAQTHLEEAREIADWIYRLDPDFSPPETGMLGCLYRQLGFATTERILRGRRHMLAPFRAIRTWRGASARPAVVHAAPADDPEGSEPRLRESTRKRSAGSQFAHDRPI